MINILMTIIIVVVSFFIGSILGVIIFMKLHSMFEEPISLEQLKKELRRTKVNCINKGK